MSLGEGFVKGFDVGQKFCDKMVCFLFGGVRCWGFSVIRKCPLLRSASYWGFPLLGHDLEKNVNL